jgi:hypothetical protein
MDVSPIKVARVYEGFMMVNKDGFISENKTPVHPLAKYLVFEMLNLSAKENFGLEKQAPCKYTKKYLLVLYVTASQPAPSELMPNNRDLSKKPSCITNENKGKSNVPEELAALVLTCSGQQNKQKEK